MACVNPDGTLSPSAKALLKGIETPLGTEEIAARLGSPLFKVRSSLRELVAAGLVEVREDKYTVSEEGKKKAATT